MTIQELLDLCTGEIRLADDADKGWAGVPYEIADELTAALLLAGANKNPKGLVYNGMDITGRYHKEVEAKFKGLFIHMPNTLAMLAMTKETES
jgi:hypothetical protein